MGKARGANLEPLSSFSYDGRVNEGSLLTESILDSISDGVFTVDAEWRVTSFNRAAETITGIPKEEAIGRFCSEVFRSSLCEGSCALRHTLETGKPIINKTCFIIDACGKRIPISVSTAVLKDGAGRVMGGAETFRDLSEVEALRRELRDRVRIGDLKSRSPAMKNVFDVIPAAAASDSTVLIQGETGTGKELVARAIHETGARKKRPFIAVNCGALPDTLLEAELFGYKKGAFTGAAADKPGRFALARNGSLFLDEIGDVSPALQVRLLRVLQERSFDPLGSVRPEFSEARIIAATNKDLSSLVREGKFREDLFYRVNIVRIEIPPLRRRKEDIPLLAEHFIGRFNSLQGKSVEGLSGEVLALFMAYDWPGNVRELENVIERAFVLCRGKRLGLEHVPPEMLFSRQTGNPEPDIGTVRLEAERQAVLAALSAHRNNATNAARALGIHRSTLYRKMKYLGIDPPVQPSH